MEQEQRLFDFSAISPAEAMKKINTFRRPERLPLRLAAVEAALQLWPHDCGFHTVLINTYVKLERPRDALKAIDTALGRCAPDAQLYNTCAQILADHDHYNDALFCVKQGLQSFPANRYLQETHKALIGSKPVR